MTGLKFKYINKMITIATIIACKMTKEELRAAATGQYVQTFPENLRVTVTDQAKRLLSGLFPIGMRPGIGVRGQCELCTGWAKNGEKIDAPSGYNVSDFFNKFGKYLGPDIFEIEPIFREMTQEEIDEYLHPENE